MLGIFAKSFMTATRHHGPTGHQGKRHRFESRREAEIEAHLTARRRD